MPGDDSAVTRGFAEELVVPEPDGATEKLRGGHEERRVPQDVVKAGRDAPGAKGVEQHGGRVVRFVGVELVKKFVTGSGRVRERGQFAEQRVALLIR